MDRGLLDARALVGHLVPEGSMFWFLATHRGELFADEEFADLFPSGRGRPSLPAPVAAAILTLQSLHDLSDAETGLAARCDLRWMFAVGMALDVGGFHLSTLSYWRQRLARAGRPHRINDAVRRVVEETGVLAGRRRRAVDSTILADAVATQDTITQLIAAIRRVARQVPGAAAKIQAVCTGHDYTTPGKPKIDWEDPAAKDALVSALVNDAGALVAALQDAELDERAQAAVALLALVSGQDVEPAEGSDGTDGRWRIARKVAPDRVISTVDPQARHTRKSPENRRDGYRAHLAAEPGTGLITDCEMTMAAGPGSTDAENGVTMAARDRFHRATAETGPEAGTGAEAGPGPGAGAGADAGTGQGTGLEVYGDSAYGSGEARAAYREAGHDTVIKPGPLRPAVLGGFTADDFAVDEASGTVTCPAGVTRQMSQARTVTFGAACSGCPLRQQCTTAKDGRSMTIHPHEGLLRAARAQARTAEFRQACPTRSMIERIIAWTATQNGHRIRLRYIGTARNDAWLHNRCAAINLRTLLKAGLTRRDGAWALD